MSDILEVAPNNIIIWSLYESIKVFVGLFLELNTTAMKWQQMMDTSLLVKLGIVDFTIMMMETRSNKDLKILAAQRIIKFGTRISLYGIFIVPHLQK